MNATDVNVVVDKVTGYLDAVAQKLGVGAAKVWPWLVKQQMLEGTSLALIALIGTIGTYITIKGSLKWWSANAYSRANDETENYEAKVFAYRIIYTTSATIFTLVAVIAGIEFVSLGALKLFNPEYYALMDLISAAK